MASQETPNAMHAMAKRVAWPRRVKSGNDDWKATQQAAIVATGMAPGADSDAAILVTLQPGAYTTFVRGKNNATGIAIVEAFLTQ